MTRVAGNRFGATGGEHIGLALRWAANVVTTSAWCSLDTCVAGNEESHTLHPFKAKRVCDFKLPQCKGKPNHICRRQNRVAEDTYGTPPSVKCFTAYLHVQYFIIITLHTCHPHPLNGLLLCITPAYPRTDPPFVNMLVPRRIGKKDKPPW